MKSLQGAPGCKSSDSFKGGLQLKSARIKNQFKGHQKSISLRAYFSQEVSGRHATYLGKTEHSNAIESAVRHAREVRKKESEHNKRMH